MNVPFFNNFKRPFLFAHRGLSAKAPENTMRAFKLAWESGIPGIELDIRLTADEEVVVFHDNDLTRITGKEGIIEQMNLEEVRKLDAGEGERIPLLREVFEAAPDNAYFDIEMKVDARNGREMALALSKIIAEYELEESCIVSSFYPSGLREIKIAAPTVATAFIYSERLVKEHPIQHFFARTASATTFLKPEWPVMEASLKHLRALITWTVNDPEKARELIKLGAVGIISDDPTPLLEDAKEAP